MCAIFGTAGIANLNLIKQISQSQIFRGPDEQNFYVSSDNLLSMGNNRLSVIDKKNGKQPMISENKRFVTVFNGCIYNFNEIKKYLQSKNISFKTNSDTEVLVNAYMFFGEKAFNYFDGMWAAAIYDEVEKKLLLSRDYVGQKPLYYAKNLNYYIFSSQLSGILLDKNTSAKISNENLKKYYAYSFIPAPNTMYENIYQIESGQNVIFDLAKNSSYKKKYWDINAGSDYNLFFPKINKENFNSEFDKIIKQHSISDRQAAISLSGGIDSYIVMDNFAKSNKNVSSFTLGFENESYDESKYVRNIKNEVKKEIFYTNADDLKINFKEISRLINEPIGDSSILPTYIINKKIKKYSNVALGGDGGDESFFGYITFDAFSIAAKIKKFIPNILFSLINKLIKIKRVSYDYITLSTKLRKFFNSIHLDNKYLLAGWMGCLNAEDIGKLFNKNLSVSSIYDDINKSFPSKNFKMRDAQMYYYKFYLPMILIKIDQASMFNSVENRSPFLSKKIINFSLDQNLDNLYKIFNKKFFIKKTYSGIIPDNVLNRKKHGFAFPKELILKDKKYIDNLIDKNLLINSNFFEKKYNNFLHNKEDCSQYIWNELILNLSIQNLNRLRNN